LRAVAGFDGAASAGVTLVDLGDQRLLALRLVGQRLLQHRDDIAWCQQRQAWLMRHPLLDDEQHGQHHHGDVVVPGPPAHRPVIGQAALALGILEGALDPVALALHLGQALQWSVGRSVGQAVFDLSGRPHCAADNQVPTPRRRFRAIPHPDPPVRDIDLQRAACAVAQAAAGPLIRPEACDQVFHRDAVHGGLLGGRPLALAFGAGTCSPGGSLQTRWSL
jgi:hypothetical protein